MTTEIFDRVAIIGLGLIGSSLGHAIKRGGLAHHIAGYARTAETRKAALEIGFVDSVHDTATGAVQGADLTLICVPVGICGLVTKELATALKPGSIITDAGSVKQSVIADMLPYVPDGVHFIPGHPIAGTEHSGPHSGFATLFDGRWCILTPLAGTDIGALEKLTAFWQGCGSMVDQMSPDHHDQVLAITSHLPQLIAYNIVGTVTELEEDTQSEVTKFSASGFRDFTRLAASDPVMWRDICIANRDAILEMLGRFSEDLTALQRSIRRGDADKLHQLFARTRDMRSRIVEAGQDTAEVDFGRHASDQPGGDN
jgi:cyclohexadieny/prephenate dehydrogenase